MLTQSANEFLTQTGPGTPMGNLFRSFWLPILLSEELPENDCPPIRVRILGENLVAFRDSNGKVGLIDAHCPHRLAPMFFGRNEQCGLRCVYHGWKFDVEGNCVDMPNEPEESNFKHKIKIKAYPTQERGGVIWAYMGPSDKVPEMPNFEWLNVPADHRYMLKFEIEANYMQSMEGDIDSSHVSFLHSSLDNMLDGKGSGGLHKEKIQEYWIGHKNPKFFLREHDHGILIGARRNAGPENYYWRITQWLMPCYSIIPSDIGNPIHMNIRIPIDDYNSYQFRVVWHPLRPLTDRELYIYRDSGIVFPELIPGTFKPVANKSNDYLIDREKQKKENYSGIKSVPIQDMAMFEGMNPIVDRTREHLGTSDAAIIQVRRALMKAAQKLLEEGISPYAAHHGDGYLRRTASIIMNRELDFEDGAREYLEARKWEMENVNV